MLWPPEHHGIKVQKNGRRLPKLEGASKGTPRRHHEVPAKIFECWITFEIAYKFSRSLHVQRNILQCLKLTGVRFQKDKICLEGCPYGHFPSTRIVQQYALWHRNARALYVSPSEHARFSTIPLLLMVKTMLAQPNMHAFPHLSLVYQWTLR